MRVIALSRVFQGGEEGDSDGLASKVGAGLDPEVRQEQGCTAVSLRPMLCVTTQCNFSTEIIKSSYLILSYLCRVTQCIKLKHRILTVHLTVLCMADQCMTDRCVSEACAVCD